jgi:hypothetical protein
MAGRVRIRIWAETIVGAAAGVLGLITLFWKDWLETVFGWDPDHHDGSAEYLIVVGLVVLAVLLGLLARWEYRRVIRPAGLATQEVPS